MFNFSGSEIVFLLLLALIILGPEKLPDAVRKFGKTYGELKKVTAGFQDELKQALDEPMREMRDTAEAFKKAASLDIDIPGFTSPLVAPDQVPVAPAAADTPEVAVVEPAMSEASEPAIPVDPVAEAVPTGLDAVVVRDAPIHRPAPAPTPTPVPEASTEVSTIDPADAAAMLDGAPPVTAHDESTRTETGSEASPT